MEFSRQEYWSGLPFPSPGDLPNPGVESRSPAGKASRQMLYHLSHQESLIQMSINKGKCSQFLIILKFKLSQCFFVPKRQQRLVMFNLGEIMDKHRSSYAIDKIINCIIFGSSNVVPSIIIINSFTFLYCFHNLH